MESARRKNSSYARSAGRASQTPEVERFQLSCPPDYAKSLQDYYLELTGELTVKGGPKGPLPPGTYPKAPTCSSKYYDMADCPLSSQAPSLNPRLQSGEVIKIWPPVYPVKSKALMEWESVSRTLFHAMTYANTVNLAIQERLSQWTDADKGVNPSRQHIQELAELSASGGKAVQQSLQSLS